MARRMHSGGSMLARTLMCLLLASAFWLATRMMIALAFSPFEERKSKRMSVRRRRGSLGRRRRAANDLTNIGF